MRHLGVARTVTVGLDHRHQTVIHRQKPAEVVDVMRHGIEVHLQHRRMAPTLQRTTHLVEMRTAVALQQDRPARNIVMCQRTQHLLGRIVETLVAVENVGMSADTLSDADDTIHTRIADKSGHTSVQLRLIHAAVSDIVYHGCRRPRSRRIAQRIQCQSQRIDIRIVCIDYNRRTAYALLDLHTHGSVAERKMRHAVSQLTAEALYLLSIHTQRLVACRQLGYILRCGIHDAARRRQRPQSRSHIAIHTVVYKCAGIAGQHHLLLHLLAQRREICLMGLPYRCEENHIGTYHALQTLHLAALRDAGLDQRDILVALDHQKRERNTQLRVIAHGRCQKTHRRRQRACRPLLHHGLAA